MTEKERRGWIEKWLAELGVSDAPLPRAGVELSVHFLHSWMPELDRVTIKGFLKGMDLSKPVATAFLDVGATLTAFRVVGGRQLGTFYTKPGTSAYLLGIDPTDRVFRRFQVFRRVLVLQSYAIGFRVPSDGLRLTSAYLAAGGGVQYIVPRATTVLEVL